MIRSIVYVFGLCLLSASAAQAQVAPRSPQAEPVAAAEVKQKRTASFCKGTMRGKRWYLTTSTPVTAGVIDVGNDGKVKPQRAANTKAQSELFGHKVIRGGILTESDPDRDEGQSNRCFVSGVIRIAGGNTIEIQNAFIARGGTVSGKCKVNGAHQTLCTFVRY